MNVEDRYTQIGIQNDGEPAVVAEVVPEVVEETKPEPEATKPEGEEQEEGEEERPHKKSGSQRAREKAMRLEVENEMLRAQLAGAKVPGTPTPAQIEGKPSIDQFETIEAFTEALTDWKVNATLKARDEAAKAKAVSDGWEAKKEAAREKYDDFDEVIQSADASPVVLAKINKSAAGADIAYHLATHPKELKQINGMDPEDAFDALKAIEKRFIDPPKAEKRTTNAPAPIAPLAGTSVVVVPKKRPDTYTVIM